MNSPVDYIREKARQHDFAGVVQRLHVSLDAIGEHLLDLRQDQADFKPSPSEWSVGEIIYHVASSMRGMIHNVDKLNRRQEFKRPMDGSAMGVTRSGVPLDTLKQEWKTMRQEVQAKLEGMTPPLDREATYAHVAFGPLNALEWLALTYMHNRRHQAQLQRVKSAAGFPE